jgi:hypothetical protein
MLFNICSCLLFLSAVPGLVSENGNRQYTDDEEYRQQQSTDESGVFNFNADLYLNYSDTLSDIGTAVATW